MREQECEIVTVKERQRFSKRVTKWGSENVWVRASHPVG